MKAVIQRVASAKVTDKSTNRVCGSIDGGLFVLLGIGKNDKQEDADKLCEKIIKLRVMADGDMKMNKSVIDTKSSILVVSQFTLYADTKDGNRPSFIEAMDPKSAEKLYEYFVDKLIGLGINVETGCFGEYMEIETILDGPVTINLET